MSNIEKYPKCQMRTSLGNCDPIGGFCTSVNTAICEALHKAAEPKIGEWNRLSHNTFHCNLCGHTFIVIQGDDAMNYCPNCGVKMIGEKE